LLRSERMKGRIVNVIRKLSKLWVDAIGKRVGAVDEYDKGYYDGLEEGLKIAINVVRREFKLPKRLVLKIMGVRE